MRSEHRGRRGGARRAGAVAALTAALVTLSGCGVPDSGAPVVAGVPGQIVGNERTEPEVTPPAPQDAVDSGEAAELYFHAASSEWARLPEQVGQFLTSGAREALPHPATRVTVVRILEWGAPEIRSSDEHRIQVRGKVIGELAENGVLHPERRAFTHTFTLRREEIARESIWLIDHPPPGYVLSLEALTKRFEALPLYFANQQRAASLVPDVRYMTMSIEWPKQRFLLVEWLLQGPAPWLQPVADRGFPEGVKRRGNVFAEPGGRVVVNLSSEAERYYRHDLMFAQLAWTLRPRMRAGLEVRIENRPVAYDGRVAQPRDRFLTYNAAAALPDAVGYLVNSQGTVELVSSRDGKRKLPAVISKSKVRGRDYNTEVDSVALSRSGRDVAFVRSPGEQQDIWVGHADGREVSYRPVTGLPATEELSQPVWVGGADPRALLVAAAGDLYSIDVSSLRAQRLALPQELGEVSAVALAPDGYRLALVAGGRVHVAVLGQVEGLKVGTPLLVSSRIKDAVDVAWSREDRVVVTGKGPRGAGLFEVSIDGVRLNRISTASAGVPTRVAGRPDVPMMVGRRGKVLIEQGNRVYEIFSKSVDAPGTSASPPVGSAPSFAT